MRGQSIRGNAIRRSGCSQQIPGREDLVTKGGWVKHEQRRTGIITPLRSHDHCHPSAFWQCLSSMKKSVPWCPYFGTCFSCESRCWHIYHQKGLKLLSQKTKKDRTHRPSWRKWAKAIHWRLPVKCCFDEDAGYERRYFEFLQKAAAGFRIWRSTSRIKKKPRFSRVTDQIKSQQKYFSFCLILTWAQLRGHGAFLTF